MHKKIPIVHAFRAYPVFKTKHSFTHIYKNIIACGLVLFFDFFSFSGTLEINIQLRCMHSTFDTFCPHLLSAFCLFSFFLYSPTPMKNNK